MYSVENIVKGEIFLSQYLCFKKNDTELCGFSRSSHLYWCFDQYSEEWKPLTEKDLQHTRFELNNQIETTNKDISSYNEIFKNCKTLEDMLEVKNTLDELYEEKEYLIEARGTLSFLEQTLGECESNDHIYWTIS